jgi:hypothetical protein
MLFRHGIRMALLHVALLFSLLCVCVSSHLVLLNGKPHLLALTLTVLTSRIIPGFYGSLTFPFVPDTRQVGLPELDEDKALLSSMAP